MDAKSLARLGQCDRDLARLFRAVDAEFPIMIVCGYRGQRDQEKVFAEGKSKVHWPESAHNHYPSRAIDAAPLPLNWGDVDAFERLAAVVKRKAQELGIAVVWGGDWRMRDLGHWELGAAANRRPA